MLQRAGLAQALMNDPELVVLDEPMSGLDPIGRKEVRDLILELRDQGKTVFFSTHILSDVEAITDRVAIVARGQLQAQRHACRAGVAQPVLGTSMSRVASCDAPRVGATPDRDASRSDRRAARRSRRGRRRAVA